MEKSQRHDKIVVICGSQDQALIVQGLLCAVFFKYKQTHTHKCYTILFHSTLFVWTKG